MDFLTHTIAQSIKFFRARAKLSQDELATKAKISRRALARIESEKANATVETLCLIAIALDVSFNDLVTMNRLILPNAEKDFEKLLITGEGYGSLVRTSHNIVFDASKNYDYLFGLKSSYLSGKNVSEIVDKEAFRFAIRNNVHFKNGHSLEVSANYKTPKGTTRFTASAVPCFNEEYKMIAVVGFVTPYNFGLISSQYNQIKRSISGKLFKKDY
jgi:transcriptional regulator with XRE-family HTH domain